MTAPYALRTAAVMLVMSLVLATAGCGHGSAARNAPENVHDGDVAERTEMRANATRVEELLQGRFPGVRVFRHAGGGLSVQIRGQSSVMAVREPLYIVDGIVIEDAGSGGLIGINPNDIERIEVLKDISSTSFYGSRGANGVVVITMRRRN